MGGPQKFFSFRFGSDAATHQSAIMQLLKSQGHDCIQTSDGLCVKTDGSEHDLQALLEGKEMLSGVTIEKTAQNADTPKDVQVFMGQK